MCSRIGAGERAEARTRPRHGRPALPPCARSRSHTISAIQPYTSGPANMPSKPNYKYQRAERDRAKKALKDSKLRERKEQSTLRKAAEPGEPEPGEGSVQRSEELTLMAMKSRVGQASSCSTSYTRTGRAVRTARYQPARWAGWMKTSPPGGSLNRRTVISRRARGVRGATSNPSSVRRPGKPTTIRGRIVNRAAPGNRDSDRADNRRFIQPDHRRHIANRPRTVSDFPGGGRGSRAMFCRYDALVMPLAIRVAAAPFAETTAPRIGDAYERVTDWTSRMPIPGVAQ